MFALTISALAWLTAMPDTSYMYRTTLIQAAPGKLSALIDMLRERRAYFRATDGEPFILRHSQGDEWDLMLIFPMGSMESYYSREYEGRRRDADSEFGGRDVFEAAVAPLIGWRQDTYVLGPDPKRMTRRMADGDFYHIEMFVALAGMRSELISERYMENAYLRRLGRQVNMIFTRVSGAEWDTFTIGIYRDIAHFAEGAKPSPERRDEAARAAGFESAGAIGFYLRKFVRRHHDTLAGAVR